MFEYHKITLNIYVERANYKYWESKVDKIILTDIDGVVFDWHTAFVKWMHLQGYSSTGVIHHDAEIHNEFGISLQEATIKREEFNASMACSVLEPMRESQQWIKKLHEEGYHFIAITSLSDKPIAQYYRYLNLEDYFDTDVFVDVRCLPAGAPKIDALSDFEDSGLIYIDDRISNLEDALAVGLNPIMMKHAYNIHYSNKKVHQVANWNDIYKYIQHVYKNANN